MIDFLRRFVDLQIPKKMTDDKTEEHESRHRHNGFLADGRIPEAKLGQRNIGHSTHRWHQVLWWENVAFKK